MANTTKGVDIAGASGRRSALRTPIPDVEDDNPPLSTGETPIPEHSFGSAYLPSFLRGWGSPEEHIVRFAHLNCSFFSHPTNPLPPTLLQLKQHAQAICSLLQVLCASDDEYAPQPIDQNGSVTDAFDWLEDLNHPYTNNSETHNLPLYSLANTISTHTAADGSKTRLTGCPFSQHEPENESTVRLVEHANTLLELIDHKLQPQGGLLSLLPAPGTAARHAVQDTILGQWLVYTTNLVQRVSELEAEVANAREVLAGEAVVPMRLVSQAADPVGEVVAAAGAGAGAGAEGLGGRVMVFPQDRFVLANCGGALWERLNEELVAREQEAEVRERERVRALRGGRGRGLSGVAGEGEGLKPVSFLDVGSRVYRVRGCGALFVVLGFEMHPDTEGTRRVEAKALVQTVVRPLEYALGDTDRWSRGLLERAREAEVRERGAVRKARGWREELVGLRAEVKRLGGEVERERERYRRVRALERDLAGKEELVREQMEKMRNERLRLQLVGAGGKEGQELLEGRGKSPGGRKSPRGGRAAGSAGGKTGLNKTAAGSGVEKKVKGLRPKRRVQVEVETEGEGGGEGEGNEG